MEQPVIQVSVPIPEDYVLITKHEYDDYQTKISKGSWWVMKDVEKLLNRKSKWIKDNILNKNKYRRKIDVHNGGFVYYPESQGEDYMFLKSQTQDFFEENFSNILKDLKNR